MDILERLRRNRYDDHSKLADAMTEITALRTEIEILRIYEKNHKSHGIKTLGELIERVKRLDEAETERDEALAQLEMMDAMACTMAYGQNKEVIESLPTRARNMLEVVDKADKLHDCCWARMDIIEKLLGYDDDLVEQFKDFMTAVAKYNKEVSDD